LGSKQRPRAGTPSILLAAFRESNHIIMNKWRAKLRFQFAIRRWGVGLAISVVAIVPSYGANVLQDPGFEDNPIGADMHPISAWQSYGANNFTESDGRARSGTNYYKVYGQFAGSDNYTGLYQDNPATPGTTYSADGWGYSLSADGGGIHGQDQIWLEVTFRDAALNTIALYRSAIVSGANIGGMGGLDQWLRLPITNAWSFTNSGGVAIAIAVTNTTATLVAPPGTEVVRYQTVFHQGPDNANGSMYFDDLSLNQISGPNTAWNIVWSDEFGGSSIAATNWTFETGNNGGWGNNELEYYTGRSQNAYVTNGFLHIVARQESFGGFNYTSARMKSQNHFSKQYGRIEFRAKMPSGVGFWPALWMLGNNFPSVGWPACGEIDIMENKGSVPGQAQGTIHYSNNSNQHVQSTGIYDFPAGNGATNFHTYLLNWADDSIQWSVDGQLYETQTSWSSSTGPYPAPFNLPFYFIMNLAVGGNYVGNPSTNSINANAVWPGEMQVDYVRVYDLTPPLQLGSSMTNGNVLLSWPSAIVCHLQAQTNATGLGTNWFDVPVASTPYVVPVVSGVPAVFYRLSSP
jgi:beta-glucanase (GH16 family)